EETNKKTVGFFGEVSKIATEFWDFTVYCSILICTLKGSIIMYVQQRTSLPANIEQHLPPQGATSVLLVVPRYTRLALPHHGVRYLAATLQDKELLRRIAQGSRIEALREADPPNIHVRILDLSVSPSDFDLDAFLKAFAPSLIGVTANSHSIGAAFKIAGQIKANPATMRTVKVVGGYLPSALPNFALKGDFQIAAMGYGEETLGELVLALHFLKRIDFYQSLAKIPGIFYRERGNEVKGNERRTPSIPLDDLPFPHIANPLQIFGNFPQLVGSKQGFVVGSRGCVYSCKYCCGPAVTGKRVLHRSPKNILAEIEQLYQLGMRFILFDEEDFMLRPKASITELLDGLGRIKQRDPSFGWGMETRGDKLSDASIHSLAAAGIQNIAFGVETLHEGLARTLKDDPNLSIADLQHATRVAQTAGINVFYNLMVGTPGYGWREILATAIALQKQAPDNATPGTFKYYAGSPFYSDPLQPAQRESIERSHLTVTNPDEEYPIIDTSEMTEAEIRTASNELDMLLFCLAQAKFHPPGNNNWTTTAHGIVDAFRINAIYDLLLNSGGKPQSRTSLLKNLSADIRTFLEKRSRGSRGFSSEEVSRDQRFDFGMEYWQYLSSLLSLSMPEDVTNLLDQFLQSVNVEGGLLLAQLPLQKMRKFIVFLVQLVYLPLMARRSPFIKIAIENEHRVFEEVNRLTNIDVQALAPKIAQFMSGATNSLEVQGILFEIEPEVKTLKIRAA
ncbi:MAG: radical SAM protein, partial [Candidatus Saganbacteria bacterium]|nr:radical SAM protein [Candidatus Saganbacteria bacterium]